MSGRYDPANTTITFRAFIRRFDTSKAGPGEYDYLQDYIAAWLEHGNGIWRCGADFGNIAAVVAWIVMEFYTDQDVLEYVGPQHNELKRRRIRRVKGVFDPARPTWFMDRDSWEELVRRILICVDVSRPCCRV
jgi:hypothetical protein